MAEPLFRAVLTAVLNVPGSLLTAVLDDDIEFFMKMLTTFILVPAPQGATDSPATKTARKNALAIQTRMVVEKKAEQGGTCHTIMNHLSQKDTLLHPCQLCGPAALREWCTCAPGCTPARGS